MSDKELELEELDEVIVLEDEDGNELEFELGAVIPYEEKQYVVLLPLAEDDNGIVILELQESEDEEGDQGQHRGHGAVFMQGDHALRIGCAVAGNVARELMHILHQLGLILGGSSSADTPAKGDLNAGGLALEGSQNQSFPLPQVKTHPVNIRQRLV